ncbi:MAG TPA: hypothetical protein VIM73_11940, partial [Polyangiaceae bacterium]
ALHWAGPAHFEALVSRSGGPWSAPLDDVFIHFDFARATARGFPFEWIEGNGYSSGGTSLLYPFVLAIGYRLGFRELQLMEWAAVVACVCTFATLLAARRLAADLPRPAAYLLPFGLLSVGALAWSLFSGMEVALFLALWGASYLAYEEIRARAAEATSRQLLAGAGLLGLACGLMTATRPEGVTAVAVLLLATAVTVAASRGLFPLRGQMGTAAKLLVPILAIAAAPSMAVLGGHAIANLLYTGETTAAGALVKLEAHHPYLNPEAVREAWWFHVKYQILRVTHHHFADQPVYGWIVWAFAAAALVFRSTRRPGAILWCSAVLWILLVATNGQVRWQNERYSMPAVAWILLAAALGAGALFTRAFELRSRLRGPALALGVSTLLVLFAIHQRPRFRDQIWFFGRAARNILDQHVTVGTRLRFELDPPPRRVLVGDAGAVPYVSDLPALDIIGLGGFRHLPFARATRHHVGAALELIERLSPTDRPDLLAIYPGWWGDFPLWFGTKVGEVPVRGNVICGGASKVLYRPNWQPLDASGLPFSLRPGERVVGSLDHGDLLSESANEYRLEGAPGFVTMKLLNSPSSGKPLWDAGRVIGAGAIETFRVEGLQAGRSARLVVRAAPTEPVAIPVFVDGRSAGEVRLLPSGGWVEATLDGLVSESGSAEIRFGAAERDRTLFHVFVVQGR